MIQILQELSILCLSTIFMLFFLLINIYHKEIYFTIDSTTLFIKAHIIAKQPIKFLYTTICKSSILFRLLSLILICGLCLCLFFYLTKNFSLIISTILVIPLSLFIIYIFYYLISLLSIILIKIINVGSFSLNFIFALIYISTILVIPLSLFIIYIFYYLISLLSIILIKIINVGSFSLNFIFALIYMNLCLIYFAYPLSSNLLIHNIAFYLSFINLILCYLLLANTLKFILQNILAYTNIFNLSNLWKVLIHNIAFYLSFINLILCYLLLANTLKFILQNILAYTNIFNLSNLWKVALLIIFYFLSTLTLFCYIGSIYYVNAYSINNPNIFDLFYYVVITFGTIGYGDIYPTCYYTKAIAILIVFTSISCISIMLSSFLSVSHEKNK